MDFIGLIAMDLFGNFIYLDFFDKKSSKLIKQYSCFFKKIEILSQQWLQLDKWLYDYHKTSRAKTHGYATTSVQSPFNFWLCSLKPSLSKVMMAFLKLYSSYISCFTDLSLINISEKVIIKQRLVIFIENFLFKVNSLLQKLQTAKTLTWQYFVNIEKNFSYLTKQVLTFAIVVDDLFLLWLAFCETLLKMKTILQVNTKACHKKIVCIERFLKELYIEFASSIFSLKHMYQSLL